MSDEIEVMEVQGCRGRGAVAQPCGQAYYQDWRSAQPAFRPDSRVCQPFGQPQFCGGGSDGSNTGPYWDNARNSENQNQMQYWGAKQDGNIIRTANGKAMDVDYGNGNWAHSPHDSNSVTVHRDNRTEHWVPQQDGRWYDQINNRTINNNDLQYDPRTGKLVIEGQTFDPTKPVQPDVPLPPPTVEPQPEVLPPPIPEVQPEVLPPPREVPKMTGAQMLEKLAENPFDVDRLHHLMDGMSAKDRITVMRDATRAADAAVAQNPNDDAAKGLATRAHAMMGRELLPELMTNKWNTGQLKQLMEGMGAAERFTAMGDAIKFSDALSQARVDFQGSSADQVGATARGSMAFMCADLAREYEAQQATANPERKARLHELAGQCKWRAVEWIMAAGHMEPKMYSDPTYDSFRQSVQNAGLPGRSADFILQKGRENPNWFFPTQQQIASNRNAFQDAYEAAKAQIGEAMRQPRQATPTPTPQPTQPMEPRLGFRRRR